MVRVKRGNIARNRRKKILKLAKGFRGSNGSLFRTANQRVMKALCNAYRDRKRRKRDFRRLWIARINAAARTNGMSYSKLIGNLKKAIEVGLEEESAEILGGDISKTLMVGDSETDSNASKAANIPFVLIKDGYTEKKTNEIFHDHLVKDFVNIREIIIKLFSYGKWCVNNVAIAIM